MDVLIIDDERGIRDSTRMAVEAEGHYAESCDSAETALVRLKEDSFDLIFLDLRLGDVSGLDVLKDIFKLRPQAVVVMFTAFATVETAVKAIQQGAFDYLEKPFTPDHLRNVLAKAAKQRKLNDKIDTLQTEVQTLKSEASKDSPPINFETNDPAVKTTLDIAFKAAPSSATIMILGESGTGKSVIAKAIHERSSVSNKPFVTISCPSLSKQLLESELFGHVRGAFTGAVKDQWGKVKAADGGTLFLDEIGELPMEIQPKLLRLLQEKEYERLGENKTRSADVRVIAATNRNLEEAVRNGDFREDLYYRLNVISLSMPSLRERPSDLRNIIQNYVEHFSTACGKKINGCDPRAMKSLLAHPWPGNLRELRNVIERAVILTPEEQITESSLAGIGAGSVSSKNSDDFSPSPGDSVTLEELEATHIRKVLASQPTMKDAAQILGINKATLYRKRLKLDENHKQD